MDPLILVLFGSFASLLALLLLLCLFLLLCHRRLRRHPQSRTCIESGHASSFDPSLPHVSLSDLVAATNDFDASRIIGDGGFGVVYRADLPSGVAVAVKKLNPDAFQGLREFRAEMETLGRLRHPNVVKILGYCVSGDDRLLVYEFVERGSLDEWLYGTTPFRELSWEARVRVVRGVANGLGFLHGLDRPIIHRDIKAGNVLLGLEFEAHIADFGLARVIEGAGDHKSTQAAGTMGYMPPEYKEGLPATVKGDVYSFGVLMYEIATRRRPSWPMKEAGGEVWLVDWAKKAVSEGRGVKILDESIPRSGLSEAEVTEFFEIARLCTAGKWQERPPMCEVIGRLSRINTLEFD